MDETVAVRFIESVAYLNSDLHELFGGQCTLTQPLGQSLTFHVLHHQEVDAVLAANVV